MSLKEKLQELKNDLHHAVLRNRDYEFDAELENHPLGNQNIYRLYFMDYHRIGEGYGMNRPNNIGIINWPFKPFMLPDGMSRDDAFKVLSYLTDFIEKEANLEPCSYKSVAALDKVIDLKRLGFKRLNMNLDDDAPEVIDLFTIKGRILLFKQSKQYQKYFEWYTKGVTFNQVKRIYDKCGIEFYDLIPTIREDEKIKNEFCEEIIQEIFRQLLIKNNIADDYVLIFEDYFKLIKDKYKGVSGTVNVFKDQNNMWNVWEIDGDGENYNISNFDNQIEAYIDAAKRRGLNLCLQDFIYNENDIQNMLNTIQSAKSFLKSAIDFYDSWNVNKLIERYSLLESFEKEFIKNQDIIDDKELTKKRIK